MIDNLSHSVVVKDVCQNQKQENLADISTQLKLEVSGLQDQEASLAAKTMKLEEEIYNSKQRTVLKCQEVMNHQTNLVENRSSPTCVQRLALAKYLLDIFHL